MDGGLEIEYALRDAVEAQKDYYQFAGAARSIAMELGLNDKERDRIFGALAKFIREWEGYRTIPK